MTQRISRSCRRPGKTVGSCVYVHRQYHTGIIPLDTLTAALELIGGWPDACVALKWNRKTQAITFQDCPEFDTAHEPAVGLCIVATAAGTMKVLKPPADPMIWHHKWLWVADGYRGFDVAAAKRRSLSYEHRLNSHTKRRIGRKSYWDNLLLEWNLPA